MTVLQALLAEARRRPKLVATALANIEEKGKATPARPRSTTPQATAPHPAQGDYDPPPPPQFLNG